VLVVGELHPQAFAARTALRRQWTVSILGRYVPGNVLMVAGRMELARGTGVPRRVALAASTYEQILMLGASAFGALAFVAYYGDLGRGGAIWLVAAVPLLFVLLHPTVMQRASGWALRKVGREPLTSVLTGRQATGLFLLYALVQALVGLATWMIVRGTAGPAGDALWGTLAYQLAFTLSMLAFIFPAGLGVRDGVLALALAQELPTEVAVAAAVLVRLAMTMFEIAFVAVVSALGRRR
jgi:glycosyltransferase 2 family protein